MNVFQEEDVRGLFDLATNSMNFGSGFMDDDEVALLRRTAVLLGRDPIEGTPYPFRGKYPHKPKQSRYSSTTCELCGTDLARDIHA